MSKEHGPRRIYDGDYPPLVQALSQIRRPEHNFHTAFWAFTEVLIPLGLKKGDQVLDVGCGTGQLGHWLRYAGIQTAGLDINPAAIKGGRARFGPEKQNLMLVADAQAGFPFSDKTFEAVVSSDIFEHFQDEERALRALGEMARVLKDGGRMLHKITVIEDGKDMDNDATHRIKWPVSLWENWFKENGWRTAAPTTRNRWYFCRRILGHRPIHGYFLLEKKGQAQLPRTDPFLEVVRDLNSLGFSLTRFEVQGRDNLKLLEKESAIIVFFPHCGHPDGPAVRKALREYPVVFPAAEDYWGSQAKAMIASAFLRAVMLSRQGAGGEAILAGLREAERYLNSGFSLVISPEGTRSSLPSEEREFKTGTAELVLRTGKKVIPIRILGLEEIMPKGSTFPRLFDFHDGIHRRQVRVIIGPVLDFEDIIKRQNLPRSLKRKEITARIKEELLRLS